MNGPGENTEQGANLVVLAARAGSAADAYRPSAPIVTQLFAASLGLPQARARRRASTEEGVAAYGATRTVLRNARRETGPSWPA